LSDLDGTLLRSDQLTSDFTNQTINTLVQEGLLFSYATARSYITAQKVAGGIQAGIPVALYNGAFIRDSRTRELLVSNFFTKEEATQILRDLLAAEIYPIVYSLQAGEEHFSYWVEKINPMTAKWIDTRKNDPRETPVHSAEELFRGEIFYFSCIDREEKLLPLLEKYREIHRCIFSRDIYFDDLWLEILPKNASKANAARQLAARLGCDKIVAFGDGKNDMDLFAAADECYAVSNAHPDLKAMATGVIGSNDEDAVAHWIAAHWREYGSDSSPLERGL
jgi:Cof subfamily protein (haloacid dehalogenase superfamily)